MTKLALPLQVIAICAVIVLSVCIGWYVSGLGEHVTLGTGPFHPNESGWQSFAANDSNLSARANAFAVNDTTFSVRAAAFAVNDTTLSGRADAYAINDTTLDASVSIASQRITALSGNSSVVMSNGGTPYNLTTALSRIPASPTSLSLTLPSAGSYLINADIYENLSIATVPTSGTRSWFALCDAGNLNVVANSERLGTRFSDISNVTGLDSHFTWVYTNSTGSSELGVCVNISSVVNGQWAVSSDTAGRSVMSYMRLP